MHQDFFSITTSDMFLASLLLLLHPISGAAFMKDTDEFETDQEDEQEVDQAAYPEADLEAVKSVQWP